MIPDALQTIAEISIGLAGFSGLVVALRRNPGPLTRVQQFRLRVLLVLTFGAMFLSLLPGLLADLRVPADRIWFDAAGAMLLFSLGFVVWLIRRGRQIATITPEIFNWLLFSSLVGGHVVVLLLQGCVLAGIVEARAPGIYELGLVWYLFHAAQQFTRMLFVQPRSPEHA